MNRHTRVPRVPQQGAVQYRAVLSGSSAYATQSCHARIAGLPFRAGSPQALLSTVRVLPTGTIRFHTVTLYASGARCAFELR